MLFFPAKRRVSIFLIIQCWSFYFGKTIIKIILIYHSWMKPKYLIFYFCWIFDTGKFLYCPPKQKHFHICEFLSNDTKVLKINLTKLVLCHFLKAFCRIKSAPKIWIKFLFFLLIKLNRLKNKYYMHLKKYLSLSRRSRA